jgi:hypothetical protein
MNLNLEPHEITIILKALAELLYKESAVLIRKIVEQSATNEEGTT